MTHLTVLVAWHDSGWNGQICRNPKENKFCESFGWIRKTKFGFYPERGYIKELKCENNAGRKVDEVIYNDMKWCACVSEISIFHKNFINGMLYGWWEKIGMNIYAPKEEFIDLWMNYYYNEDGLCFVYCRENPLSDEKIICACIKPKKKSIIVNYVYNDIYSPKEKEINENDFERLNDLNFYKEFADDENFTESYVYVRIKFEPEDVIFIIPYQELVEYYGGYDRIPEDFILPVPNEARRSFRYGINFLSNELAIAILEKALKIVEQINKKKEEDPELDKCLKEFREKYLAISEYPERIKNCLKELKKLKFKYPGLPSVLRYLGLSSAVSIYINAVKSEKEEEMYNAIKEAFERNKECSEYGVNRKVLNNFNRKARAIREFLIKYLPFYDLTKTQVEEIFKQYNRRFIDLEKILKNPYLLYEDLRPREDVIELSFWEIDGWESNRLKDEFNVVDKRRIRALLIAILRRALSDGHTVLPLPPKDLPSVKVDLKYYFDLINNLLPEDRRIDFERFLELIEENKDFISEKVWIGETEFKDELNRVYKIKLFALKEIREKEKIIENFINRMLEKEYGINISDDEIRNLLTSGGPKGVSREEYERAINDQVEAVKILLRNGCSILTGSAGSGKTYTIKALLELICKYERPGNITILAPTGKASVRIRKVIKNLLEQYNKRIEGPMTIHRFITMHSNFDWEYYIFKPKSKISIDVLIIDEASMIGTELLHDLLQCVDETHLKRIIFVGDVNQLPPIEAGKPFFDSYNYLQTLEREKNRKYIAKLEVCLRSESRKIVELSKLYIGSTNKLEKEKIIDELISSREAINDNLVKYSLKDNDGTERVVILVWQGDDERFYEALEYAIDELIKENGGDPNNYRDFFKHFVFNDEIQILTPTRTRGKFSSFGINYWIRDDSKYTEKIRDNFIIDDFTCNRFSPRDFADKVIQTVNNWRLDVWDYEKRANEKGVFNGMMGYVAYTRDGRKIIRFYFPTVWAFINKVRDQIEYAYAITTHKSQGSEFNNVIFILPKLSKFISKELMYTALTRAARKLYIIIKDSISDLLELGKFSEISSRYSILFNAQIDPRAYPESLRIITLRGDIVRSWQECLIANLLCYENIDYVYEPKFEISGRNLIPDFRLYSEYESKTIFWEHFGMMDNEEYRRDVSEKLRLYEMDGFGIIELGSMDEQKLKEIFDKYDKILIVSYTEDVRNSNDLYNKIKILKSCLHIRDVTN